MAPKAPKAPKAAGMSDETYFLWVCLRLTLAKTGEQPNWNLVSEAVGGTKPHTLYCRFNTLCKNAKPLNDKLPDLEGIITQAQANGTLAANRKAVSVGMAKADKPKPSRGRKPAAKKGVKEEISEESDYESEIGSKRKRKTAGDGHVGVPKKVKSEPEMSDEEVSSVTGEAAQSESADM